MAKNKLNRSNKAHKRIYENSLKVANTKGIDKATRDKNIRRFAYHRMCYVKQTREKKLLSFDDKKYLFLNAQNLKIND